MPLTVRKIEATKPGPKPITLIDGSGLQLVISPKGSRGWRLRYTRPNGKRNMMSLGSYPEVTLAQAREKRTDARRLLAQGIDPVEQRQQEKREQQYSQESTFRVLAHEWHATMAPRWKVTSKRAKESLRALENYIFPYVGDKAIEGIKPLEWLELLKRIEQAGKFEQRRKVHSFCRDIYRFAIITGRASTNPLSELSSALIPHKQKSFPHVSQEELPELVNAIESYHNPLVRIGLTLLLMTALRPGEMRQARWEEIDFQDATWSLPSDRVKMGRAHRVPLPTQALAELRKLHMMTGQYGLLFPGRNDPAKPLSDAAFGMALKRMGFEGRHVPHGTRHVVATGLKEMGYPGEWIEMQLSHKLPGIQGVYTHAEHMAPEQRPAMMQAWANWLESFKV
ncbi:tyrosine-type recombinase/integrase [Larsenimonas suaedae]|uniref:Integrase arm-type DNA-binding domain-containing protein n=1 Tax=Larsenimonas suaedae TaxID=1851019 RepID=A0ABU1GXS7_9GAMM|nr:integrase arm-type DNA-binding domain-containing protein [Larsenimonas suaedae]MCM2973354.1 integrase arm-type DNA-binding domain-containing protein [Larsenimonas suaedae]MDR5896247.1 integrase arm-type DNA-binding domain-containing protein [Larsenimonas suaedae]